MASKNKKHPLTVIHSNCAGIDIGSREHWVAVNPDTCAQPVRSFTTFSDDLVALADWLQAEQVDVVAMEATGVYWIPLYELLDERGFDVQLVNSRSTRQVSGRKSDVLDCQWIRQLMSYGLLKGAFRPGDAICALRSYVRQRATLVREQARYTEHMQKALTQMNIQLDNVVSDLSGKTGMAILRGIIAGERDPKKLAQLRDRRLRADAETVARSLMGNWREEHLFALTVAVDQYDFTHTQIASCDAAISHALSTLPMLTKDISVPVKVMNSSKRTAAQIRDLHQSLNQVMGVDLTAIPCIGIDTVLVMASEIGADLSRFATVKHFCAWLGLAPPTKISGGKNLSGKSHKVNNRVGQALRQAAVNARRSESFIGANHRSRLARMDTAKAVKATAHQLARLIYAMLTKGQPYVERGIDFFEAQKKDRQLRALQRKANKFGMELVLAT